MIGFIPIMGAPALAILTAHSPGVKPSPSPCGPEASCYYIIILRSNIVKLIWSYEHMIIYMIIFIWAYMIIWSDIINLIYMIWPMHIVAATGLLYRKARSIAHSISRMLWKYWKCIVCLLTPIQTPIQILIPQQWWGQHCSGREPQGPLQVPSAPLTCLPVCPVSHLGCFW